MRKRKPKKRARVTAAPASEESCGYCALVVAGQLLIIAVILAVLYAVFVVPDDPYYMEDFSDLPERGPAAHTPQVEDYNGKSVGHLVPGARRYVEVVTDNGRAVTHGSIETFPHARKIRQEVVEVNGQEISRRTVGVL